MITLSRHIEILLLEHDCVIIPGLGGFIANQVSSLYCDNGDNLFLPPYRTVGFNQALSGNDGLLVQSYMQAYEAAYPEAMLQMEKDINEMLVKLDLEGSYTFHGVGTLTKNIEGGITFTAPESGVLTPSLYGLYSFEVKDLAQVKKEKEIQKAISQTSIIPIQPVQAAVANGEEGQNTVAERQEDSHKEDSNESKADKRNIIIRLNKRWAEVAAATAAAVILFFFLTYPSLKSNDEMSDTCIASTIYVGKPSDLPKENITARSENVSTTKVTSPANEQAGSENTTANKTVATQGTKVNKESIYKNKDFVIVLASCVTAKNAQLFIDNLNGHGFNEARYVTGEKNRVVYSGYSTYTEATNALIGLRKQNSAFEEAWVLHMNK